MNSIRIIVMGAGYVGMALLKYFQRQPYSLFITTTQAERIETLAPYGKVLLLDQDRALDDLIQSCDAMIVLVAPKHSQSYEETYLNTAKQIHASLQGRKTPFYLLYTSSTSVCEGIHAPWVTEEMPLGPKSENAKILLATEQLYQQCNANVCILRLGGIYGPGRELDKRARIFSGKEIPGSGEEPTNHIHLSDIVDAIAFSLEHSLTGVYHLVNDDHRTRKEIYSTLCTQLHIPLPIWNPNLPQNRNGGYKVSNQKIKSSGFVLSHNTQASLS